MNISIKATALETILTDMKNQLINIDVFSDSKEWSGEYFEIEEIKHLRSTSREETLLVLKSKGISGWQIIPLETIEAIRLDKPSSQNEFLITD